MVVNHFDAMHYGADILPGLNAGIEQGHYQEKSNHGVGESAPGMGCWPSHLEIETKALPPAITKVCFQPTPTPVAIPPEVRPLIAAFKSPIPQRFQFIVRSPVDRRYWAARQQVHP